MIMLVEPSDGDGLILPQARPTLAWSAVAALSAVGRGLGDAADRFTAAPSGAHTWTGDAATAYRGQRADLSRRLVEAAAVAVEASALINTWYDEAGAAVSAMRLARCRVEDADARIEAARARAEYWTPELTRAQEDAWNAWGRAKRSYWDGVQQLTRRLLALRDRITDRPWDGTDQLQGFARGLRQAMVTDPASFTWGLTGEALVDRDAWWANVSGLPGAVWQSADQWVRHPVRTASEFVDADGWRHGRYGEAAAVAAEILVPGPKWLAEGRHEGALRYAHTLLDPSLPKPKLQTVDEMLAGVDLARHEHAAYGHTLSRHVDVDDEYLMDRVTHGTLLADGKRGFIPDEASRFADRPTAERVITDALRADEDRLRRYVASGDGKPLVIRVEGQAALGRVIAPAGQVFDARDGTTLILRLKNGPDGPYIMSAYLE